MSHRTRSSAAFLRGTVAGLVSVAVAAAQCDPVWLNGDPSARLSGHVITSTSWDPDGAGPASPLLIVAGDRLGAGPFANVGVGAWDGTQWVALGVPLSDRALGVTTWNGALVVAFETAYGVTTVAAWNGTSWQAFGTFGGSNGYARSFATFQGSLYAGGVFATVDGTPAANIARWDGTSWSAAGSGQPHAVYAMVPFLSALYVSRYDASAQTGRLATWTGTAWTDIATCNGSINALAVRNTTTIASSFLVAGGSFTQWTGGNGTIAAQSVVRYSPSANSWAALGSNLTGSCLSLGLRAIGISNHELVAVRYYYGEGLWQWNGTTWVQLGTPTPNPSTVTYYGGAWHLGSGLATLSVAMQRLQTGAWVPLVMPTTALGPIQAVLDADSEVVVGGAFGIRQGNPGAWNPIGGGLTGTVTCLARLANGDLVAGGAFAIPGGTVGQQIARWNGTAWSSLATGMSGPAITMLALPDGGLIVGGSFTGLHGIVAPCIAQWTGSAWQPMGGGMNAAVHALVRLPNGDVVAGGDFTLAGSVIGTALHVARWNGSSWSQFGPGLTNPATDLAVQPDGQLVAITPLGYSTGGPSHQVVRSGGGGWSGVSVANLPEAVLALPDGDLLCVGTSIQRLDGGTTAYTPVAGNATLLASAANGDVLVGGDFASVGTSSSVNFARLHATCPATAVAYGPPCVGSAGPVQLAATSLPWLGGTYRARATGLAATGIAFDLLGFAATSTPLAALHPAGVPGCNLLVDSLVTQFVPTANGQATVQHAFPNTTAFVGVVLRDQVLQLELGPAGVAAVAGTNGLQLTLGRF